MWFPTLLGKKRSLHPVMIINIYLIQQLKSVFVGATAGHAAETSSSRHHDSMIVNPTARTRYLYVFPTFQTLFSKSSVFIRQPIYTAR